MATRKTASTRSSNTDKPRAGDAPAPRSRRKPADRPAAKGSVTEQGSAAAQQAAQQAIQSIQNGAKNGNGNPAPSTTTAVAPGGAGDGSTAPQPHAADTVVIAVNHNAMVASIRAAMASFRAGVNLEIAVACACFVEQGGTSLKAKKELLSVYAEAGYDCKEGGEGADYKTVNRRINFSAQFFDSLTPKEGEHPMKALMGGARDEAAIQMLLAHIATKYNFKTMEAVATAAGVQRPAPRQRISGGNTGGQQGDGGTQGGQGQGGQPQGGNGGGGAQQPVFGSTGAANPVTAPAPQGVPSGADAGVAAEMAAQAQQRAAQQANVVTHTFEGATVVLPLNMSPSALGELGIKLMHAANQMRGATLDVQTLNAEFKEMVAG